MKDLYEVLGVPPQAALPEIKRAYRAIARHCHPDMAGNDPAKAELFREATEAYNLLSDPAKRAVYDCGFAPADSLASLLLDRPIGNALLDVMLPSAPKARQGGVDVVVVMSVPEEVLRRGGAVPWPEYRADGRVDDQANFVVPAGADLRPWCRLPGLGTEGRNGGDPGDLYVLLVPA
jgi:curved DNA-binding protein CbpA